MRLVAISWDEISTVADIAHELIRAGDPRGHTLTTLVQEYANSQARTPSDWSRKAGSSPAVFEVLQGGDAA